MSIKYVMFSKTTEAHHQNRLRGLKDKHKGKRCFCVGNGPSLKNTPLHLLNNEYSFGLNNISKIYPSTTWRPSFYVNVTIGITDEGWASAAREASKNTVSFIKHGALPYVLEADSRNALKVHDNIFPVEVTKEIKWQHDITKPISKYGSSMLAVMQIATYMGFNPIYLVGCDCKWVSFDYDEDIDPNHFVDTYWGKLKIYDEHSVAVTPETAQYYTDQAKAAHILAKYACDKIGVRVYNATVGGDLEVYPRADFMQIVQDA
jgi:hypothetical protein